MIREHSHSVLWVQRPLMGQPIAAFAFLCHHLSMRTMVYVDGFNFYYLHLRNNPHFKWLNLKILAQEALEPHNQIIGVKYYTARVSGKLDLDAPARQQALLSALDVAGSQHPLWKLSLLREVGLSGEASSFQTQRLPMGSASSRSGLGGKDRREGKRCQSRRSSGSGRAYRSV